MVLSLGVGAALIKNAKRHRVEDARTNVIKYAALFSKRETWESPS